MNQHCYIVLYDLCQPNRNYSKLYEALKSFANWGKLTESAWAIVSNKSAVEICNYLNQYIDADDRLMVILSGKVAAWTKVLAGNEWLKANIIK